VEVTIPPARVDAIPSFVAELEILRVTPDAIAKIIINGRTGTVVMGSEVRISTVAIAHGGLTVEVKETPTTTQPNAFADGQTATTTESEVSVSEATGTMKMVKAGTTLAEIVEALNTLGATPRDLVDILLAMKAAGAIQAELEII
jgi:flagellar P-ring protein precursor FlgI